MSNILGHVLFRRRIYEKNTIISEDNKKICTKKECVYINENNIPILELEDGKIEKGSWSFGPVKRILEKALMRK